MDTLSLFWNIGINYISWKIWAGVIIVALIFTWQIWGTIWLALPMWLKITLIFIVVAVLAYFGGRNTGAKNERDLQQHREADAINTREKIDATVKSLDEAALDKRLNRWMRRDS